MENQPDVFRELFHHYFSDHKIKSDFFSYLSENFDERDSVFLVPVYKVATESVVDVIIAADNVDVVTVISRRCTIDFDTHLFFNVAVAVENISRPSAQAETCQANLRYDCTLHLFDIEFTLDGIMYWV